MRNKVGGIVWATALALSLVIARAQSVSTPHSAVGSPQHILRAITDPHTGQQWLLVANEENPAGPGRLVMASCFAAHRDARITAFAIHAGDKIVVEEHGLAMDAYLEATALETAAVGSQFKVRLKIGGRVLKAVALGPGKAEVQP